MKNKLIRNIVIPDVRFPNEIACIHKYHGQVIYIVRPPKASQETDVANHLSEYSIGEKDCDRILVNYESTKEQFQADGLSMIKEILNNIH